MFHYMHKVLMQTVQMKGIARDEPISGLGHQWVVEFEIDVIFVIMRTIAFWFILFVFCNNTEHHL